MEQQTIQRLNDLSDQIELLYKPLKSSNYTAPINRAAEKERFFQAYAEGQCYNPQFTYHTPPSSWEIPLKEFLLELKPDDNPWESLIYKGVHNTALKLQAIEAHNSQKLTQITLDAHGGISEDIVQLAYAMLHSLPLEETVRSLSAEVMAHSVREALDRVGLSEWKVNIKETMSARMSVSALAKKININMHQFFAEDEIKRLIIHEIGTHVFRSENGSLQPLRLLARGLHGYLATEEGLASYHEAYYGLQSNLVKRLYALRVVAAHKSLSHSFFEVFKEISKFTASDEAFDIVTRAKRGFSNTEELGSYIKDKVYFEGFLKVSQHLSNHPNDYELLMCGKVSIETISLLKDLSEQCLLVKPKFSPDQLIA